jgi:aldehyde:ferredoxin oxidoreductase
MRGYAGKYLEVDLSNEKMKDITFDEQVLRKYIGGRGLATKILWDRLGDRWETINPLGPENILLVLTGPLTGFYPGGRICISGKSPQSNGIVGSTIAGEFPIELKCAGYDGLIITGRAAEPVYLFITDTRKEVNDASHIWGKDAKETLKILTKEGREKLEKDYPTYGEWKEPAALYIGPAGENRTRVAAVCGKWTHAAGYGGYGGVMGSKNVKAILAKSTNPLPEVNDMDKVQKLMDAVSKISIRNDLMRRWGTGVFGYETGAKTSSEPVRNWQDEWHDEKSFGVDKFEQRVWVKRYWGDFGCPTTCLKIATPKFGPFKGAITDNPDYEIQAYAGTNLGIFTPEANVYVATLLDDLGLCGIQGGNVLGFAAELYQRGILTKEDLGGIELDWGNAEAFAALLRKIALREGIGEVLAEGTYRAALKIGNMKNVDALQYAVTEKGVAIGAHGIRSGLDYVAGAGLMSYACSVQGGDHTSIAALPLYHGNSELTTLLHDSGVYCLFNIMDNEALDLIWDFYEAVTGWRIGPEEWYETTSRRVIDMQRAALLIGGPDLKWAPEKHDDNPPRFYEPLPKGPYAGKTIDRTKFEEYKREYYEAMHWDEKGMPTSDELKRLGLENVLKKLRKTI